MKTVEQLRQELAEKEAAYKRGKWQALFGVGSALVGVYFALARTDMNQTSIILIVVALALGFLIFTIWLFRSTT